MKQPAITRRGTVLTASGAKGIVNKRLAEEANLAGADTCVVADAVVEAVKRGRGEAEMVEKCFELVAR